MSRYIAKQQQTNAAEKLQTTKKTKTFVQKKTQVQNNEQPNNGYNEKKDESFKKSTTLKNTEKEQNAEKNQQQQQNEKPANQQAFTKKKNQNMTNNRYAKLPRNKIKYNWDPKIVTLDTQIPPKPTNIAPKPNIAETGEKIQALYQTVNSLKTQIKKLQDERNLTIQLAMKGRNSIKIIQKSVRQQFPQENNLINEIRNLRTHKNKLLDQLEEIKKQKSQLGTQKMKSKDEIEQQISRLKHILIQKQLNAKQQKQIYRKIGDLQILSFNATHNKNILANVSRLNEKLDEIKNQLNEIKVKIKQKQISIDRVTQEKKVIIKEQIEKLSTDTRSVEEIRQHYSKKIESLKQKKDKNYDELQKLKALEREQMIAYRDQQDLLDYIEFVKEEQFQIKRAEEERERRKKQKEEDQLRRKKEIQQKEKKRIERQLADEERKKKQQQRKLQLIKEREIFVNRQINYYQKEQCKRLIEYCKGLLPVTKDQNKEKIETQKKEQKKDFQKQFNEGTRMIVSKKEKKQQEVKVKQTKREKIKQQNFINHNFAFIQEFQNLKVLPPKNINQLLKVIPELQEKLRIFSNPSEQEKQEFKRKLQNEFDQKHGFNAKPKQYKQKDSHKREQMKQKKFIHKAEKVITTEQFPQIE